MGQQQREHFRIDYPLKDRGSVQIRTNSFPIVDVSQSGIKFSIEKNPTAEVWELDKVFKVSINFLIGKRIVVEGKIIRVTDADVTLRLNETIPLGLMNEEHRYIIKTFNRKKE